MAPLPIPHLAKSVRILWAIVGLVLIGNVCGQDDECRDGDDMCGFWASKGECENNPSFMLSECAKSCNNCKASYTAEDNAPSSPISVVPSGERHSLIATDYNTTQFLSVHSNEWRMGGMESCQDKDAVATCENWRDLGECRNNPSYVHQHCANTCQACRAMLPPTQKCVRHPDEKPSIEAPGGLNKMFERIIADPVINLAYDLKVMSTEPYVLVFENFVTTEEGAAIKDSMDGKWEASTVVGEQGATKLSSRTSSTAWCTMSPCSRSSVHMEIQKRVAKLTGTDPQHMEFLQVLQYEKGQRYANHHDHIDPGTKKEKMPGPRLLTAFFYFSDAEPEDGGATKFTNLGFQVSPKVGRMVLWPSMMDEDSNVMDARTHHEAMVVNSGFKFAANLWIHQYDFKTPYGLGCVD
eukprot:m.18466 g.18466  ORF g.18466 m.18466 type:complete len:409 (-) comp12039_c1_seq1:32-1258(-)